MASKIFISYRRDDVAGHAGRLYDHLVERFGEGSVFMDIDTVPPGEEFDGYIDEILRDCYLCIVVIGQRWSPEHLHTADDWVRREIIIAFQREVRVIPALFDGARLPNTANLPPELSQLTRCQTYDFGAGRNFKRLVSDLLTNVDRAIKEAEERKRKNVREALSGFALRPYQYPFWVLFVCALVWLAVFASLSWVPVQVHALASLWKAEAAASKGDQLTAMFQLRRALKEVPSSRTTRIKLAKALFSISPEEASEEAMTLLEGMRLNKSEWSELITVMPAKYREQFHEVKSP
jgi:TIR domain